MFEPLSKPGAVLSPLRKWMKNGIIYPNTATGKGMGGLAWRGPSASVQWLTTTTSTLATGCTTHMDHGVISNLQNEGIQKRTSTSTDSHPSGHSQSKIRAPPIPQFSCWVTCPRGRSRSKDSAELGPFPLHWTLGGVAGPASEPHQAEVMWCVNVGGFILPVHTLFYFVHILCGSLVICFVGLSLFSWCSNLYQVLVSCQEYAFSHSLSISLSLSLTL